MRTLTISALLCFSALAQTVTIGPAVFTGSGLNDATSSGFYTVAPANAVYVVTISATGTPDHFTWTKNGGSASAPIAITGVGQALADGVTIMFAATTGHTLGNLWTITVTASGSIAASKYIAPGVGAQFRNAQDRMRERISALDFGADPTGAVDSTAALAAGVAAATLMKAALHVPAGAYKVSNASGLASVIAGIDTVIEGDGWLNTKLIQQTNGGTTIAVQGDSVIIRDLMITKASGVTGGTGISIYPDVTSAVYADYSRIEGVAIYAADCAITDSACQIAANANRLDYGILIQSGTLDSIDHWISHTRIRWAVEGLEAISGGLAGSAGPGAAQALWIDHDWISDTTDCLLFVSSGENFFPGLQCTNASNVMVKFAPQGAGAYAGFQSSNSHGSVMGEASAGVVDFGDAASYVSSHCSQSNIVEVAFNEILPGTNGGFQVNGDCQLANVVNAPGIFQVGFYKSSAGTTVDPFLCAGMIDAFFKPCTATVDFRSTANVQNIFRFRNTTNTAITSDWVNWNPFSGGYQWQPDSTFSNSAPVFTIFGPSTVTTATVSQPYLHFNARGVDLGGIIARYYNSSVSAATTLGLYAYNASGTKVVPLWPRGDGAVQWGASYTVATVPTCNGTGAPTGTWQSVIAVADLVAPAIGSAPTGGGFTPGLLYCNGSTWHVMIF